MSRQNNINNQPLILRKISLIISTLGSGENFRHQSQSPCCYHSNN